MQATNKLVTELSLDSSKFKSELASAKTQVSSFSDHAKNLGVGLSVAFAAASAAALAFGHTLLAQGEKIEAVAKNAERLGISTQSFQSLAYAANIADTSMDSVSSAIARLQKNVYAAQQGNEEAAKSFQALGLDANKFKGMAPDQIFLQVKDAVAATTDSTKQLALAQAVMGRGATSVMNLLKADIQGLQAEYASLGVSLSDSQEKAVGSANDTKKTLGTVWEGLANQLTADVAPAFEAIVKSILDVVKESGGIKTVAASMAESLVSGMILATEAYNGFLKILDRVFDKLTDIGSLAKNVFQRLNVAGNTLHEFIRFNPNAATDPRVVGTVDEFKSSNVADTNPRTENTKLLSQLYAIKDNLHKQANGQAPMDSYITPLGKFATAVDNATTALKSLKSIFGIDGKEGENYIKSRLSSTATKQATNADFDAILQEIKDSISKGELGNIRQQISGLKSARDSAQLDESFNSLSQQALNQTPEKVSFSSMNAAIAAVEKAVAELGKKPQEVVVRVKVDEQGMIKAFSESPAASAEMYKKIDERTAAERAAVRG